MTTTDATGQAVTHRPDARLQRWGGVAAVLGGLLMLMPSLLPMLPFLGVATFVAAIASALLLVAAAVLLAKAAVRPWAGFGWQKLGGILLILFHAWRLALMLVPHDALLLLVAFSGDGSTIVRALVAIVAGIAIAKSWPLRGFDRWSMLLVATAFVIANYGGYALASAGGAGTGDALVALSALYPLALVAFGVGHAVSGSRGSRTG